MSDLVIIGAGLTAAKAVETLRDEGFDGGITVVGTEPLPPYERPQLSKDLIQGKDFALVHDEQWYADQRVTLKLGRTVTSIDRDLRTVHLDDDSWLPYDQLLIATGAGPRVPELPGIERAHLLRTKADADALIAALAPGRRLVSIGGGWIGLEVAAGARERGLEVTVLERGPKPLASVLGDTLASHLVAVHERHGVVIRTEAAVAEITNDAVVLTSGESLPAEVVVAAIGAVPSGQLAAAAGLEVDDQGAIVVGDHLQTSDPAVFAAGDVALAEHLDLGPLRVEHWDNALRQGELAARSILGQHVHFDWVPYFFTDQFEFSMEYVGQSAPDDDVVIRGDLEGNEFIAYWLRDGVVTAGMNVGIWDVNDKLRELVGQRVDPAGLTDLR